MKTMERISNKNELTDIKYDAICSIILGVITSLIGLIYINDYKLIFITPSTLTVLIATWLLLSGRLFLAPIMGIFLSLVFISTWYTLSLLKWQFSEYIGIAIVSGAAFDIGVYYFVKYFSFLLFKKNPFKSENPAQLKFKLEN